MKDLLSWDIVRADLMHEELHAQPNWVRITWPDILNVRFKLQKLGIRLSLLVGLESEKPPSNGVIIFLLFSTGSSGLSIEMLLSIEMKKELTVFELQLNHPCTPGQSNLRRYEHRQRQQSQATHSVVSMKSSTTIRHNERMTHTASSFGAGMLCT